jgi:hypothetical protein
MYTLSIGAVKFHYLEAVLIFDNSEGGDAYGTALKSLLNSNDSWKIRLFGQHIFQDKPVNPTNEKYGSNDDGKIYDELCCHFSTSESSL